MSEREDDNNNEIEERFIIEDIEENHKSLMDSLEKQNNIKLSQNNEYVNNQNFNYISNDMVNINSSRNEDSKNYIIDSTNLVENNNIIINENNNSVDNENYYIENNEEGPINLIEFKRNNFILNEKALDILYSIKEDLVIVSIIGKARTGKSYLMNLLLNNQKIKYPGSGFEISSRLNSCTRGIWLWNTPRQKPNSSSKIIFIDSEGTNSVDLSTKTYDSKIFALIVLISSLFIYNTNGNIDEKSINELALAAHLSNIVASNTIEDKDLIINELAPKFIWVLRDFILDKIDPNTGEEINSDDYLELCLRNKTANKNSVENNLIRENIIKYFKDRECFTLPRPVDQEEDLHKLNEIPFSELKPNFREEFLNLKRNIYENSKVKKFGNKKINGPILVELLKSFINSLNSKIIPNINTAFDNLIINEIEKSYENSIKLWKENYNRIKEEFSSNIKDFYDIRFFIMNEYNIVMNENKEIKYNKQYFEIFNNNKNKLENEIYVDIKKVETINCSKKVNKLNEILNKYKSIDYCSKIDYSNLESSENNKNLNLIFDNYLKVINDIKNTSKEFDDDKALDIIIQKENEYSINSINNIFNIMNNDYKNKIKYIEDQIKEEELYTNSYDINQIININEMLSQRYELLSEELDLKEKEIFGLIGKYTKIVEKKEKIITNNNGIKKRADQNLSTLRSQKFQNGVCGITVETSEKGCGCQLGENCSIF